MSTEQISNAQYGPLQLTSEDVTSGHDGQIERATHIHYAVFQWHVYCERLIYISLFLSIATYDNPGHILQRTFPKRYTPVSLHVAHEDSPIHAR